MRYSQVHPEMKQDIISGAVSFAERQFFESNAFHALTAKAAQHYHVPFSCLALPCSAGIHLKARVGALPAFLSHPETGESLMCRHHLDRDMPVIIEDTTICRRVQRDPLVVDNPHVGFYVGVPIKKACDRVVVGTLCIFDTTPRKFSLKDAELLTDMASQASARFAEISRDLPAWAVTMSSDLPVMQLEESSSEDENLSLIAEHGAEESSSEDEHHPAAAQRLQTWSSQGSEATVTEETSKEAISVTKKDLPVVKLEESSSEEGHLPEMAERMLSSSSQATTDTVTKVTSKEAKAARSERLPSSNFSTATSIAQAPLFQKRSYTEPSNQLVREAEFPAKMQKRTLTDGVASARCRQHQSPTLLVPSMHKKVGEPALCIATSPVLDAASRSLQQFLQELKLERFLPKFLAEDIDIESLLLLSEEDLISLGITMGPRRKLQAGMSALKQDTTLLTTRCHLPVKGVN
eukprot:TRINITY_DN2900_c0_g1_i3.p1 TRINITY_DN2900_c0_g1~~TRINITY_DN2900_c0_g1_i3.p1  ORF type:complete len:464 (+),score=105.37 TRINITY_DN2900_c0_g1_i3:69-1460(+)